MTTRSRSAITPSAESAGPPSGVFDVNSVVVEVSSIFGVAGPMLTLVQSREDHRHAVTLEAALEGITKKYEARLPSAFRKVFSDAEGTGS